MEFKAGWYPDPSGDPSRLRYWNGSGWTNDYMQATSTQPTAPLPGAFQTVPDAERKQKRPKKPGRSLGIFALIFGIYSLLSVLFAVTDTDPGSGFVYFYDYMYGGVPLGVIGLILGIIGWRKSRTAGMPNGIAAAGCITSFAGVMLYALIFAISFFVYIL